MPSFLPRNALGLAQLIALQTIRPEALMVNFAKVFLQHQTNAQIKNPGENPWVS
jgi:hypothetical protein